MRALLLALACACACACAAPRPVSTWPQGPGPRGDWSAEGPAPPVTFSVRRAENLLWRTPLPETGQGGIAVHGRHLFVATMAPWDATRALSAEDAERFAHAIERRAVVGKDIDVHALDAETGELLWTRRLGAEVPSIYSYPFSDATSASPVTDGEHVWFTHAGGRLACFTVDGRPVWERTFTPTHEGPFNKQFEPFLAGEGEERVLVHMEPFDAPGGEGRWNHLVGLDPRTGDVRWRSEDGITHYNAPTLVATPEGPCVLQARGGPHDVPERPVGLSLTRLSGPHAGSSVWRYEDPRGNHEASLQTMAHDDRYAYWLLKEPRNLLVVLDLASGEPLREISLVEDVTVRSFDPNANAWTTESGITLDRGVFPARYSMIAAHGRVFFQCYATAWGKPTIGPPYSFARVDPERGDVEYLEVPTDVEDGARLWRTPRAALALDARGIEVTGDERSRWDGWDWVFNGSPTRVNEVLYFTLASGVVYALDASTGDFDGTALLGLGDLGVAGRTWTANSVSYADGRLYHRTAAELLCFGRD